MNVMIIRPENQVTKDNIVQALVAAGQVLEEQRVPDEDRWCLLPGFFTLDESTFLRRFHNCINETQYRKVRAHYEQWRELRKSARAALRSGRIGIQERPNYTFIKSDI